MAGRGGEVGVHGVTRRRNEKVAGRSHGLGLQARRPGKVQKALGGCCRLQALLALFDFEFDALVFPQRLKPGA